MNNQDNKNQLQNIFRDIFDEDELLEKDINNFIWHKEIRIANKDLSLIKVIKLKY